MHRRPSGRHALRTRILVIATVCLVAAGTAFSVCEANTIYYWKDPKGIYHFFKEPPKGFVPRKKPAVRRPLTRTQIDRVAAVFGKRHRIDPDLIRAIIEVESDYDPKSVSEAGAQGLMQIMPDTQKDLGVNNPFDPVENIEAGVRYFRAMLDRFKNVRLALAAYNAGPSSVEKYGGIPPFAETRKYVTKVLTRYRSNRSKAK